MSVILWSARMMSAHCSGQCSGLLSAMAHLSSFDISRITVVVKLVSVIIIIHIFALTDMRRSKDADILAVSSVVTRL